jgi:O-methyltransferase
MESLKRGFPMNFSTTIERDTQYLDLLKQVLSGSLYPESAWQRIHKPSGLLNRALLKLLGRKGYILVKPKEFNAVKREGGEDWPLIGYSMIGHKRLDNIRDLIATVVAEDIPGDFVECGVWRGGGSMYAKAVLNHLGSDRAVWCCDSFEGMPVQRKEDKADPALAGHPYLAVSVEAVRANFERLGLLDNNVKFVKGWFSESLPKAPIERISVLRLDGDYYSSTMDALNSLYDRVSKGGFVIVDDYNAFESCKKAISDFHRDRGISPEMIPIDRIGAYWRV